jgi:lysophospholipase L1-like esterase
MDFSSTNILYLNKIISLCKEKQVALILVNTPLHPYYLSAVPEKFKSRYHTIIQQSGLPYIDFSEYQFSDSMFMPDGDHVSARGAAVVTNMIKEMELKDIR